MPCAKRNAENRVQEEPMNEAKLHEFMGKFVTDMGGAWMMGEVYRGNPEVDGRPGMFRCDLCVPVRPL